MSAANQVDDFKLEVGSRWTGHDKHEVLRIQLIRRGSESVTLRFRAANSLSLFWHELAHRMWPRCRRRVAAASR